MQFANKRRPVTPMDTVGGYGTLGQVLTSNGPNAPPSFQNDTDKTLTNYTGSSTAGGVTVFDVSDALGVGGSASIRNTDASHSLDYTFTVTDMFGLAATTTGTLTAGGGKFGLDFQDQASFAPSYAPYQEIKLTITDHIGGNHATYSVYKLQW